MTTAEQALTLVAELKAMLEKVSPEFGRVILRDDLTRLVAYGEDAPAFCGLARTFPTLASALETMAEEIGRLRELLKPFARVADMEERAGAADSVMVNVARCRDARVGLHQGKPKC
jgi:type II secretory pathway component PulF